MIEVVGLAVGVVIGLAFLNAFDVHPLDRWRREAEERTARIERRKMPVPRVWGVPVRPHPTCDGVYVQERALPVGYVCTRRCPGKTHPSCTHVGDGVYVCNDLCVQYDDVQKRLVQTGNAEGGRAGRLERMDEARRANDRALARMQAERISR